MQESVEYQIYIGCSDSQLGDEIVDVNMLQDVVMNYFIRQQIDFSILSARGGYLHEDGHFVTENTVCINLIGPSNLDIVGLTRSISMFMNQETTLIIKDAIQMTIC